MSVDPPHPGLEPDDDLLRRALEETEVTEPPSLDLSGPSPFGDLTETLRDAPRGFGEAGADLRIPKRIGRYHIKGVLASGGMGTVYEATQEQPHRTVALKLMKHGITSRAALRRFEYESQILGRLQHPGIAQVYEAGMHRDESTTIPYFVMEYIVGAKPITEYVTKSGLGTRQKLNLFAQVCDAVHHGHQKGIIHRDLKPSNILVNAQGHVKIIDFGVARSTDSDLAVTTLRTDVGQLIGTLQYMSPEQCEADPHNIDTRSDVYALGVVLYELLCGQLPYDVSKKPVFECTRIIRETQPLKLSTLNKMLRGDVETIVLKALEKDRDRRYQSATDLAQDIRRCLNKEAITARPPSMLYQLRVLVRRNKPIFVAIAVVFLVLLGGAVVSTWQALRATRAERLARDRLIEAQRQAKIAAAVNRFLNDDLLAAVDPSRTPDREITMREVLDTASTRIEGRFTEEPLVEASIRSTIGETYANLGLYESAEPHLREAEAIRVRDLGMEDATTLQTRAKLADFLRRQGWFVQAEALARETLETQCRVLGDDHPDTAFTRNALGLVLRRQGKYGEAVEVLRRALDVRRRALGDEHVDTLVSMSNLASGLMDVGECGEAEVLYRDLLDLRGQLLGDEHPLTLASMSGLATALACQGKSHKAETTIRETLGIQRRVLGEEHPDTLDSMYQLAMVIRRWDRLDETEELLKRTLEARRRVLGVAHLSVASTTDSLLRVLRARAKVEEARPYVARAMAEIDEARYVDVHTNPYELSAWAFARLTYEPVEFRDPVEALPLAEKAVEVTGGTPANLRALAMAYESNGRLEEAVETTRRALAQLSQGESYFRTVHETRLIHTLRKMGDSEGAEVVLREALARLRETQGERLVPLVNRMTELAVLLLVKDRFLQHGWFCGDLAQVRNGTIPQNESPIAAYVVVYAAAILEKGLYSDAEELLRHCLGIRKLAYPETDWHVAHAMSLLGAALAGQGRFDEAEPFLLDGYQGLAKQGELISPEYRDERRREAVGRIINLYGAWDAAEPGKGYAEKATKYRAALAQMGMKPDSSDAQPQEVP